MLQLRFRPMLTIVVGGVFVLLTGAAYAITSNIFQYSTPRNGFFSIDRMAMMPTDDVAAADFLIDTGTGQGLRADSHCFNAAVNLPHGATIVRMTVWYSSVAEGDPDFSVLRQTLASGQTDVVAMSTGADNSGQRKVVNANANAAFAAVDNGRNSYGFRACLAQLDKFYAARILYTYTNAGD